MVHGVIRKLYWLLDWRIFLCGSILVCAILERSKYFSFIWQTKDEGVVPVERNCAASVSIDFLQRRSRWKPGLGFQVLTPRQSFAPLYNYLLYLYTCILYIDVWLHQENPSLHYTITYYILVSVHQMYTVPYTITHRQSCTQDTIHTITNYTCPCTSNIKRYTLYNYSRALLHTIIQLYVIYIRCTFF